MTIAKATLKAPTSHLGKKTNNLKSKNLVDKRELPAEWRDHNRFKINGKFRR